MEGVQNNQLVSLLNDMMSAHPETVRKATEELGAGFKDASSNVQLCKALANAKKQIEYRKSAGDILKKRLSEHQIWNEMSVENREIIKTELFAALKSINPNDSEVLPTVVLRNVGYVMEYVLPEEGSTSEWNKSIFDYVESLCLTADRLTQSLGSFIFRLLVKCSPKMFQNYLDRAYRIFMQTVKMAESQGKISTLATEQLLAGWSLAIPLFAKRPNRKEDLASTLPHIMRITRASAYQPDPRCTCRGFDVLAKLNKHMPELVSPHLPLVMNELYVLVNDTTLSDKKRVQAITAIRSCVRSMRRLIIRLKMMDQLLLTLHGILAVTPVLDDNDEELYLGDNRGPFSPVAEAVQTILYVAAHSDTIRVAERALRLMQPQLEQQESPVKRLAALIFLGLMAKGFTDLLSEKPLEQFVAAVEKGVHDSELMVRRGAHFALSLLAENLQPEITRLAPRVLPLFNNFFDALSDAQRLAAEDTEAFTRMFCTLEIFCESLKPDILQPHLKELMERLLKLAQPNTNSSALRQMSLSTIACLAKITKDLFSPHFDDVMGLSLPLILHTPDEDQLLMRTHAIQVINSLQAVNGEKFVKEAPKLLESCMDMMNNMAGAQVFTFELIGVLSGVIPKQVIPHFSLIMNVLLMSVKEAANVDKASDGKEKTDDDEATTDDDTDDAMAAADNENADEDDDDDDDYEDEQSDEDSVRGGHGDQTDMEPSTMSASSSEESNYLSGLDEALLCLKAFAINMPDSLLPYLSESMQRVVASTKHMQEFDKWSAYETLTQFILLYWRQENVQEAKKYCIQILPAMVYFIQTAKETVNVVNVIQSIKQLLLVLKSEALAAEGYAEMIFEMLRRTLRRKLNCQFNIGMDMEMEHLQNWSQAMHAEHQVREAAAELLPVFGYAMGKRQFAGYFQSITKSFVKSFRTFRPNGQVSRSLFLIYNMTARSMHPLGVIAEQYYDVICFCICDCMMDKRRHIRNLGIEMIDWALTHSSEYQNADTIIEATISIIQDAMDKESPLEKDERDAICGIVARMLRVGSNGPIMAMLVPILYNSLPLHEDFAHYKEIIPAFNTLYKTQLELFKPNLDKTLEIILGSLQENQLPDNDIRQLASDLIKSIKADLVSI